MLGVSSTARLKTNSLTVPTTQYTTKDNRNISLTKNMIDLQPNVCLPGTLRLVVTNKGQLAFPRANHCQGQLQTPQPITIITTALE
jgi:hypothetical protein